MNSKPASRRNERGVVIVLFAIASITLLLVTGLAVDLGIAHVTFGRMSKAVDAGALAGARYASQGSAKVKQIVEQVAMANIGAKGTHGAAKYSVVVDTPAIDTYRIQVTGTTSSPTFFSRLIDRNSVDIVTKAEAIRYPLDLSLVLDQSGSLDRSGSFPSLQAASKNFLNRFDDSIDQVGIVGFATWAWEGMSIRKNFKDKGNALIDSLKAISDTNTDEGLRVGKAQIDGAPKRDKATKIVVLFTDGRPTAFADNIRLSGTNIDCVADTYPKVAAQVLDKAGVPECYNGVVATYVSGSSYRGLFQRTDGQKVTGFKSGISVLTDNLSSAASPQPLRLPGGDKVTGDTIRSVGITQSEAWADSIRAAGYTVYCVGLGDPKAVDPLEQPDLDFLKRLANQNGIVNASQPKGEMMFAPSAVELDATFSRLADHILTRLTQ